MEHINQDIQNQTNRQTLVFIYMDIETGLQVVYEVILNIEIDQMHRTFLKHVLKISLLHKPKAG